MKWLGFLGVIGLLIKLFTTENTENTENTEGTEGMKWGGQAVFQLIDNAMLSRLQVQGRWNLILRDLSPDVS